MCIRCLCSCCQKYTVCLSIQSLSVLFICACVCLFVYVCVHYICISLLFIPNVYFAQGNPGEPGLRGPTVRIFSYAHTQIKKYIFLTFGLEFQGPMGGNGPPGAPGVKVNTALFDIDPRISFISSNFRSTIIAWTMFVILSLFVSWLFVYACHFRVTKENQALEFK